MRVCAVAAWEATGNGTRWGLRDGGAATSKTIVFHVEARGSLADALLPICSCVHSFPVPPRLFPTIDSLRLQTR